MEDHDDDRGTTQAEPDRKHASHTTGSERDLQRSWHRARLRRRGSTNVAAHCEPHADEAGEARHHTTGDECQRAGRAGRARAESLDAARLQDLRRSDKHNDRQRHQDDRDGFELTLEVRHRALLDRGSNLLHFRGSRVGGEDALHQEKPNSDRKQCGRGRADEDNPFTSVQRELLVATLGGQYCRHGQCSLNIWGLDW